MKVALIQINSQEDKTAKPPGVRALGRVVLLAPAVATGPVFTFLASFNAR